jgi:branched-chain amino acid transport system substrate-binding protein
MTPVKYLAMSVFVAVLMLVSVAMARDIKVGMVLPLSGGGAQFGDQVEKGAMLYYELHKTELGDDTLTIIKRDAKNPGGAVSKAVTQELIVRDKVDILTGYVYSPNAISIAPLVTKSDTPVVIMNAGTAWIPNLSPNIARVSFTMWQAGYTMGEHAARKMGCGTAVSGYTNYPPGKDSVAAFKRGFEGAGGKVLDEIPMGGPREVPDFTPFFQRAKDQRPNCFYVFVPAGNHATAIVKTFAQLGMQQAGITLIGPGDLTQDTKLQAMGDAAVGLRTMHHYSADYQTPENRAFVAAWKRAYGADSTPDFMGVQGYDGMAAIFHIVKTVPGNISGGAAMEALKGWHFTSPRGPIFIDPETRDIVQDIYLHEVTKQGDRLMIKVHDHYPAVKDKCKELKLGKCGAS